MGGAYPEPLTPGGGGIAPPGGQHGAGCGQQGEALATLLCPHLWQAEQPAVSSTAAATRPPAKRGNMASLLWPRAAGRSEPFAGSRGGPKAGRGGPSGV